LSAVRPVRSAPVHPAALSGPRPVRPAPCPQRPSSSCPYTVPELLRYAAAPHHRRHIGSIGPGTNVTGGVCAEDRGFVEAFVYGCLALPIKPPRIRRRVWVVRWPALCDRWITGP
jgi:hypothetical protein